MVVSALVVVVAVGGVLAGRATISSSGTSLPPAGGSNGTSGSNGSSGSTTPTTGGAGGADVAARVDPALVDVDTVLGPGGGSAAGTGLVLAASGVVLTNNHVVEGATAVSVTDIGNGHTYEATVVGTDKSDDVAVLRLSGAASLATVTLGDSSKVSVGDEITAIGNAGGTGGTPSVTTGSVTALDQAITASDEVDNSSEQLTGLFQTNAALQPGDSGGPLVDGSGQVVGIDTAASAGFQFQAGSASSYAIPIDEAISIARQIQAGDASSTVHIGPAALLGVVVTQSGSGAGVIDVEQDSAASQAGIVTGDVITSLGGQPVDSPETLSNLMYVHHPGDMVRVGWTDTSGQQQSADVELTTGPTS